MRYNSTLTFGELFAGVGGFSVGFEQAGWNCAWQVEIDKHCQSVLARHWPDVPHYQDVCECNGNDLSPVDCITFGSPCQDLSVAGKRAGLTGQRSNLFYQAIRIIEEMRHATAGAFPRFAVWENVPGAFTSNEGHDFGAVIDSFAEIGALDIAWRVVDAQHFGVPQRRRRILLVADFRGECAGAIHTEPAGMRWHSSASHTPRTKTANSFGVGVTQTLTRKLGIAGPDVAHAEAGWLVPTFPIYDVREIAKQQNGKGYGDDGDPMFTLTSVDRHGVVQPFVKAKRASSSDDDESWHVDGPAPTLNQFDNHNDSRVTVTIPTNTAVRRLTPRECERLQGFSDDHTRWRADGREQFDSHRYQQLGNAVCVPVAAWLAQNLRAAVDDQTDAGVHR